MSAGDAEHARSRSRALTWGLSLVLGGVLLWLASLRIELWPREIAVPRPGLLAAALALHLPYAWLRAFRLRYALGEPIPRDLLIGSGWVSFLVILLLPLRMGELSRPLLLAREGRPGLGLPEAISAIAGERVVDGLAIVAMLFVGLTASETLPGAVEIVDVRAVGRVTAAVFVLALALLSLAARWPVRFARLAAALGRPLGAQVEARARALGERLAGALRPLFRQSPRFVLVTALYWGVTVLQLWLVAGACGLALDPWAAATVVAVVGLSIQLPGGPAQAGSFQVGVAAGLTLYVGEATLAGPGSSFAAVLYAIGLGGSLVFAIPGAALLARSARKPPAGAKGATDGP